MIQHLNTFLEILNEPPSFDDDDNDDSTNTTSTNSDENACEGLLKEFTDDEKTEIANVSYAFWIVNLKANERLPVDGQRNSALKEIRRHYVGENRDPTKTLSALKEAMDYRRQYHVNILRSCCYENYKYDCDDGGGEAADLAKKYRSFVIKDLERQPMVVRGIDDKSRTIVYKSPRMSSEGNDTAIDADEAFLMTQLYTAEKAMATNEFESKSKEERLTVVFNFRDYSRKNSPSMYTIKTLVNVLQRCYPERLGVLMIIDPPFWIRSIFNIVWPLLSTATTEKIKLPSGQAAIDEAFHEVVGGNEKLAGMLANGEISSIDLIDYTKQPFYCQFE